MGKWQALEKFVLVDRVMASLGVSSAIKIPSCGFDAYLRAEASAGKNLWLTWEVTGSHQDCDDMVPHSVWDFRFFLHHSRQSQPKAAHLITLRLSYGENGQWLVKNPQVEDEKAREYLASSADPGDQEAQRFLRGLDYLRSGTVDEAAAMGLVRRVGQESLLHRESSSS